MRKRQFFFCPLPGMPCAGSFPLRASPSRVLRGISRNDAARSALTKGSGLTGEEGIEFDTIDLTDEAFRQYALCAKNSSAQGQRVPVRWKIRTFFEQRLCFLGGGVMQNRHTLMFINKLFICCCLPAKIGDRRNCTNTVNPANRSNATLPCDITLCYRPNVFK